MKTLLKFLKYRVHFLLTIYNQTVQLMDYFLNYWELMIKGLPPTKNTVNLGCSFYMKYSLLVQWV